eukprot:410949-Prymnesium_polylepis.1
MLRRVRPAAATPGCARRRAARPSPARSRRQRGGQGCVERAGGTVQRRSQAASGSGCGAAPTCDQEHRAGARGTRATAVIDGGGVAYGGGARVLVIDDEPASAARPDEVIRAPSARNHQNRLSLGKMAKRGRPSESFETALSAINGEARSPRKTERRGARVQGPTNRHD